MIGFCLVVLLFAGGALWVILTIRREQSQAIAAAWEPIGESQPPTRPPTESALMVRTQSPISAFGGVQIYDERDHTGVTRQYPEEDYPKEILRGPDPTEVVTKSGVLSFDRLVALGLVDDPQADEEDQASEA